MNLILCGLPCSGKTFYGKRLAETGECDFFDLDCLIESEAEGLSCREIFLKEGEELFRQRETHVLESLKCCQNSVIALGGGTLTREINISLVLKLGTLVYLKTPMNRLLFRLKAKSGTPAYLNPQKVEDSFKAIASQRISTYERNANITLDTENFSEEEILHRLKTCLHIAHR